MTALIIEDEMMARSNLERMLKQNFPEIEVVGGVGSVREAVNWLESEPSPGMIFMDVELSDGDCFEIFRQIKVTSPVVMTTAYDQYAIKAFEVGGVDYLLKPIDTDALRRAVTRCAEKGQTFDAEALAKALRQPAKNYRQRYIIRFNDHIVPVETSDIAYVYSEDKSTVMVSSAGKKYFMDESLEEILEELNPENFFRISRSCIISISAIGTITRQIGGRLKIETSPTSEIDLTVSRSRVEDFLRWLEK